MIVFTFYADCNLPEKTKAKQAGFDWQWAMDTLEKSAAKSLKADTLRVTDCVTVMGNAFLRVGCAVQSGIMLWLLNAQASAISFCHSEALLVSPDTIINGPVDVMFGDWDVCILTRERPKPIVNSVIAVRCSPKVGLMWSRIADRARMLSEQSRIWGADIDALVDAFCIRPFEDGIREFDDVRVRFLPVNGIFKTIPKGPVARISEPIWDFKGYRKQRMPEYARFL